MDIPLDVTLLIEGYYGVQKPQKLRVNSFKFGLKNALNGGTTFDLCVAPGMDTSYWTRNARHSQIDCILFVLDLTTYDESMVDENGKEWNRLEHAMAVWDSCQHCGSQRAFTPKMIFLTERDRFEEQIKSKPLSVCPTFSGLKDMDTVSAAITAIRAKVSPHYWHNRVFDADINGKGEELLSWIAESLPEDSDDKEDDDDDDSDDDLR